MIRAKSNMVSGYVICSIVNVCSEVSREESRKHRVNKKNYDVISFFLFIRHPQKIAASGLADGHAVRATDCPLLFVGAHSTFRPNGRTERE